jgi:hypothetical protein
MSATSPSETLLERLRRKLAVAAADREQNAQPQDAVLDEGTALDTRGALQGAIYFRVQDAAGAWHVMHRETLDGVEDAAALDDVLARGLSLFLMKHPTWPR